MGIGKFQSILISLCIFIIGLFVVPASATDDKCAYNFVMDPVRKICVDPETGKNPYLDDQPTKTTPPANTKSSGVNNSACGEGDSNNFAGCNPVDQAAATAPESQCKEEYKQMVDQCKKMSETGMMAALRQSLIALQAATANNATASVTNNIAGNAAASYSTLSVAKACISQANECSSVCKKDSENIVRPPTKDDKVKIDAFARLEKLCSTESSSMMGNAGMTMSSLLAALAQAAQAMKAINTGQPEVPLTTYEPPTFSWTQPSGPDYGVPPGSDGDVPPGEYAGNPQSTKTASYGSNEGASGGAAGFGGGAYPGGAPNGQGGGGAASGFKDPGGGLSGGGGYSVSGVPFGGGGGGGGGSYGNGRDGRGADGLDLSKFLPGGENDPAKRGLASVEKALQGQGITGANDLSNFEKVSRMMNRKRAALKP